MNSDLLQIIIFAAIAAFVIFRLRSVLGRRTGHEQQRPDTFSPPEASSEKVVPIHERRESEQLGKPESPVDAGLTQIKLADRSFDKEGFLAGARAAFEMIVIAFAEGDLQKLKPLLAKDVYDNFANVVQSRYEARETLETSLVGIKSVDVLEAGVEGRTARIAVKVVSEQVNVTKDRDGNVVDGDPNEVEVITDIWTFSRDTRARDPNWLLVETGSPS
ncbi:MAG: Tim44/TimA family putative adaptor protein [Pseudomonadota bacterium]